MIVLFVRVWNLQAPDLFADMVRRSGEAKCLRDPLVFQVGVSSFSATGCWPSSASEIPIMLIPAST